MDLLTPFMGIIGSLNNLRICLMAQVTSPTDANVKTEQDTPPTDDEVKKLLETFLQAKREHFTALTEQLAARKCELNAVKQLDNTADQHRNVLRMIVDILKAEDLDIVEYNKLKAWEKSIKKKTAELQKEYYNAHINVIERTKKVEAAAAKAKQIELKVVQLKDELGM